MSSDGLGLSLRFFGSSEKPQIALYFSLYSEQQGLPDFFKGHFVNKEGESVNVELRPVFNDMSGSALSEMSTGTLTTKEVFSMRLQVNNEIYVRAMSSQISQRLPFMIQELIFSPESG